MPDIAPPAAPTETSAAAPATNATETPPAQATEAAVPAAAEPAPAPAEKPREEPWTRKLAQAERARLAAESKAKSFEQELAKERAFRDRLKSDPLATLKADVGIDYPELTKRKLGTPKPDPVDEKLSPVAKELEELKRWRTESEQREAAVAQQQVTARLRESIGTHLKSTADIVLAAELGADDIFETVIAHARETFNPETRTAEMLDVAEATTQVEERMWGGLEAAVTPQRVRESARFIALMKKIGFEPRAQSSETAADATHEDPSKATPGKEPAQGTKARGDGPRTLTQSVVAQNASPGEKRFRTAKEAEDDAIARAAARVERERAARRPAP